MSETYECKKYMHVFEIHMHVRNLCMYFQKYRTANSGLQIEIYAFMFRNI